jgi:PAS domain S-box-containing protein
LGAIQYLQVFSSSYISFEFLETYTIYPVSVIIFSSVLFAVLLIYIKEGVASARTLILGIIISNFLLTALAGITFVQESVLGMIADDLPKSGFNTGYKYFIIGTIILLFDFVLLVIIYQYLITKIKKAFYFIVLFVSLLLILFFDAVVFNVALKSNDPEFINSLISHFIAKSIAAFIFSLILYLYLKYIDKEQTEISFIANQSRDVFSILTYRKKYLNLKIEKDQVEKVLTSKLESTLNNSSDGFVSLDTNWCYTYVNNKAGEFLGREATSLIGKHIWTEFPEGVNQPFYKAYYKAVETQQTQVLQEFYEPFDKWFENRIYPSSDGLTIYFTDITEQKKADLALKESENHIRTILETEPECIKQLNAKGELIYMNPAGLAMIEADTFEMVKDQTVLNLISPNDQHAFKKLTADVFKGKSGHLVFEITGIKGTQRWLETHAVPLKDTEGTIISLLGVTRDITNRKKIEEELIENENLFRRLTTNVPVGIFQTDLEGSCNFVNDEWIKYAGLSFDEGMGYGWSNAIHPEDRERVLNEWQQAIKTNTEFRSELRFQNQDNKITWLSAKAVGLSDSQNNLYGYIGMVVDITEKIKAKEEITNYKNHLEELVALRTFELEKEKKKAQSADLMKSTFLATMSHELRTPMNSIIGFTGMLLKQLPGPLNEEQNKQLTIVKNSSVHLLGLINDILDISKIEADKLELSLAPFNYLLTIENTIEFLSPQVNKKELQIKIEFSETKIVLNSDERRVEQVLMNLLSNAIKFSNKGTIFVKVAVQNNFITTQIIDQGIGISKEDQIKLFNPFTQLNTGLSRSYEGTGLGLAICKSLIEKLGGTIQISSKKGEGSNFTFKLPLE